MAWTKQEIANKIDWEGGLDEAISWGLRLEHIPEDDLGLRIAFQTVKRAHEDFTACENVFLALLPGPGGEDYQ